MRRRTSIVTLAGLAFVLAACGGSSPEPTTPAPRPAAEPEPFPSEPPAPLPVQDLDFPDYEERTLRNGASLVVVENREQPVASIRLVIPGGSAADPEGVAGLASVTASQLDKGTERMTAAELAEAADFIGANLGASASSDWSSIYLTTITDFLDEGLELLSDIVLNPTFPQDELATEKRRRMSQLRLQRSQPGALAQETFTKGVYGDHPYGDVDTEESIQAISADDLADFHRRHYRPGGALFVVSGDVDPDAIARELELAFASWEGAPVTEERAAAPPARSDREMIFVHKPGSVQAVMVLGHLMPSATDADWVTLDVTNQVLGSPSAQFNAWMMSVLREEKGYTYGAYSQMTERPGPGTFAMRGEFRNEVADSALTIMLELANRIRSGDIPADDLRAAKQYLTGNFPLGIETPAEVAGQVAGNRLLGRPASYLEEYRGRVADVDVDEVAAAASRYIHPDRSLLVVVGDAGTVLEKVRPFADRVSVVDAEGDPLDLETVATAADLEFDASEVGPRRLVYGIEVQGNSVAEVVTEWKREGPQFVIVSDQTVPMAIHQETRFEASTFAPTQLKASMGALPEIQIDVREGRATGTGLDPQTQQTRDIDAEVAAGTGLEGMVDVAIAVTDFDDVGEFTFRTLSGTGDVTATNVSVEGEETVTVPAGEFETYRLGVTSEQVTMTVWVTQTHPHIVVKREIAGQPVQIVLNSMR